MDEAKPKQTVAFRLSGGELCAVDALAALAGSSRTGVIRAAVAAACRGRMLSAPAWPMHPAWVDAGFSRYGPSGEADSWVVGMFNAWCAALATPDPSEYLEPVDLDGVRGFRFRTNAPAIPVVDWLEKLRGRGEVE